MTTSSQPTDCSTTYTINSNDTISIDLSAIQTTTIGTIDFSNYNMNSSVGGISISPIDTITIGSSDSSYTNIWEIETEWDNSFPEWNRVQDMCKKYPGLQIAFEKFKTVYKLVKDDYDAPKDD